MASPSKHVPEPKVRKSLIKEDSTSRRSSDLKLLAQASTKAATKLDTNITSPRDSEKNEELLSLIACLNEQAIKEISEEGSDLQIGQSRLLKAYKIIVEAKANSICDSNYQAIVCYNLACSY